MAPHITLQLGKRPHITAYAQMPRSDQLQRINTLFGGINKNLKPSELYHMVTHVPHNRLSFVLQHQQGGLELTIFPKLLAGGDPWEKFIRAAQESSQAASVAITRYKAGNTKALTGALKHLDMAISHNKTALKHLNKHQQDATAVDQELRKLRAQKQQLQIYPAQNGYLPNPEDQAALKKQLLDVLDGDDLIEDLISTVELDDVEERVLYQHFAHAYACEQQGDRTKAATSYGYLSQAYAKQQNFPPSMVLPRKDERATR